MPLRYQRLASAVFVLIRFGSSVSAADSPQTVELIVDTSRAGEEIDLTRYSLGQGGISDKPMIDPHVDQLARRFAKSALTAGTSLTGIFITVVAVDRYAASSSATASMSDCAS